jgi:hypothetical protein
MLRWAGFSNAGDPRAEKQLALATMLMDKMAADEGLNYGDSILHPSEPLAITGTFGGYVGSGFYFAG